ncbi:uncharacterized protein LOC130737334 [Lotus japonicus]|uniref:uncharacterized protein LOC130737334 n=1 Tax=Lotus japonicus TaxID=34305 RepID=UPI002584C9F4|nr:uncharacterized protein LOC130737334 [Lotus japonicus]
METKMHEAKQPYLVFGSVSLLFSHEEDGYQEDIPYREPVVEDQYNKRDSVTLKDFVAFCIQDRRIEYDNVIRAGRLFQQFIVDAYTMIESQRLNWVRFNQNKIRVEVYSGLHNTVDRGDTEATTTGKRIILPASYMGSTRYMFNNCQDAMTICMRFGYPDLFITMTCNANWPEIKSFVESRRSRPDERPDILVHIFKMKVNQLMKDFKNGHLFGKVDAGIYTVEFQKRGLPHAHILIWLQGENKLKTGDDIDKVISAELPDRVLYPKLHVVVSNFMIHGPCGSANKKSLCMEKGMCTKFFPKKFQNTTTIDEEGYPQYRRRQTRIVIKKKDIEIDNMYVVPYNPTLLMRYQAHIDVEYCNKSNAIKYLFKYINKGADRAMLEISHKDNDDQAKEPVDEVKQYYDCHYLSPCEAAWRIFGFIIHKRWPSVQKLNFHLPNEYLVYYNDDEDVGDVLEKSGTKSTKFMTWFAANEKYREGQDLTYAEFPSRFVYHKKYRIWKPRKRGFKIGRLQYIPPGIGLRIAYADLKILCIIEIEKLLQRNGRSLNDYPCLPTPEYDEVLQFDNRFIVDEQNYDKDALKVQYIELLSMLTPEQKSVYERVVTSALSNSGGFYFLYGYGGTEKTFVWNTLSASLRSKGLIVLTVTFSGIASLLLPGGRTAHSKFCIPLDATKTSTCNIKQGSLRAKLLLETSLIIWDEAPMLKKYCFEALDVTLRDLMRSKNEDNAHKPFRGKVIILGSDFRQILPVITRRSRQEIVESTVNSSYCGNTAKL